MNKDEFVKKIYDGSIEGEGVRPPIGVLINLMTIAEVESL